MHPNPAFRATDEKLLLAQAAAIGFAHIFTNTSVGPMVLHAPITRAGERRLTFHVARANRIAPHLDGARLLISVAGPDGYVSPNWYPKPGDQVPTWNYVAMEIEGQAAVLDEAGLTAQLDALAATHEPRVNPGAPWTRDKMAAEPFRNMLRAIIGFTVEVETVRGTTKLSQNKADVEHAGVVAGLEAGGNHGLADAMRS